MAKILGLDLGTNSIGWAVIDNNKEKTELLDKGVHIFSEGVKIEKGIESSKAAERTQYRSARRIKFRRKLRKQKTLEVLIENKMCPLTMVELNEWRKNKTAYPTNPEFIKWLRTDERTGINPYYFRDKASKEKLLPFQLGRAFYHLAQRRGFLSNRLDQGDEGLTEQLRNELLRTIDTESNSDDLNVMLSTLFDSNKEEEDKAVRKLIRSVEKIQKENNNKSFDEYKDSLSKFLNKKENLGAVKKGIADISQKMNEVQCETLGQYFYKLYQQKEKIRTHYTARNEHYLAEFKKICETQQVPAELCKELEKAIFYQRPLRSQKGLVAKCSFEKKKPRCPVSHPAFEEYRALQFINSIKVGETEKVKKEFLTKEERQIIWHKFTRKSKPNFDFSDISKVLTPKGKTRYFNYTDFTSVSGCFTIAQLINIFGESWKESIYEKYTNKDTK
jgi:CRISPR-associated endonuclease Csn1